MYTIQDYVDKRYAGRRDESPYPEEIRVNPSHELDLWRVAPSGYNFPAEHNDYLTKVDNASLGPPLHYDNRIIEGEPHVAIKIAEFLKAYYRWHLLYGYAWLTANSKVLFPFAVPVMTEYHKKVDGMERIPWGP